MKELSIEEKAKAYDEAVINGSRLWECGKITRENYEYIFPELAESEDERIRKDLLGYLHTLPNHFSHNGSLVTEWIAWLEKQGLENDIKEDAIHLCNDLIDTINKQGEQKPAEDGCKNSYDITTEEKDMIEYKKGFECGKQRVLKYPEDFDLCKRTLTAWSEEDERMYKGLHDLIDSTPYCNSRKEFSDWLKSLKERVQPQPRQEWSEKDNQYLCGLIGLIEQSKAGLPITLKKVKPPITV